MFVDKFIFYNTFYFLIPARCTLLSEILFFAIKYNYLAIKNSPKILKEENKKNYKSSSNKKPNMTQNITPDNTNLSFYNII